MAPVYLTTVNNYIRDIDAYIYSCCDVHSFLACMYLCTSDRGKCMTFFDQTGVHGGYYFERVVQDWREINRPKNIP